MDGSSKFKSRLTNALKVIRGDESQDSFAKRLGMTRESYSKCETRGSFPMEKLPTLSAIAKMPIDRILNDLDELAIDGGQFAAIKRTPVVVRWVGEVSAGPFMPDGHYDEHDIEVDFVKIPDDCRDMKLYAVTVRGTSMNMKAPPDSLAVFVSAMDYTRNIGNQALDGKIVVVKHDNGLQQYETTLKRYHYHGPKKGVLKTESWDPKYADQTIDLPVDGTEDEECRIIGVVIGIHVVP